MKSTPLQLTAFLRGVVRLLAVLQMNEAAYGELQSPNTITAELVSSAHLALAVEHQARDMTPPIGGEGVRDRLVEIAATQYELFCALLCGDVERAQTACATQQENAQIIRLDVERLRAAIAVN